MHRTLLAALRPAGLAVLLTFAAAAALAQAPANPPGTSTRSVRFLSAGDLYLRLASDDPAAVEAGRHYIMGTIDTLLLVKDPRVCVGPAERLGEIVDAVKAQLAARPEMRRYNASSFVREVIYTYLQCA